MLAVAAVAPVTTIIPIPADARFSPKLIEPIIGAFGPLRYDRSAALTTVKEIASWPLSDAVAGRLLALYPDPTMARRMLEAVSKIPDRRELTRARAGHRHSSAMERNELASSLLGGIAAHVSTTRADRSLLYDEPFHRELVTCDERQLLLDPSNGDRLRRAGVRIGLFGIAGTGKSQFSAEITKTVLKCEPVFVQASDILAYRLGQLERNLHRIFARAREHGSTLIFDEFDSLGSSRSEAGSASYIVSLTNALLNEFDAHPLAIIVISNFGERIDIALRRRLDIVTELLPIPDALEHRAFELILGLRHHTNILGRTCVSDYARARKVATLTGETSLEAAISAVTKARDVRLGEITRARKIGFF